MLVKKRGEMIPKDLRFVAVPEQVKDFSGSLPQKVHLLSFLKPILTSTVLVARTLCRKRKLNSINFVLLVHFRANR